MTELAFPRVERPILSIVMLTRNDLESAPRALGALLEHTGPWYELIVVDNGSSDGTKAFLTDSVTGVTLLLNERNHGFGVSSNLGATHAIGRYLLFLNSDVLVHPGWLSPLLKRLEDDTIAAVGPRILNLDGSLQLAGALLTRAGATVTYGEGDDPDLSEYMFTRDVDYCSGACLAIRRTAFDDVGGFDPMFGLIYFEDADLCLSLWQSGLRTVYEPTSTVTHVGGGGSSPAQEVLLLAERNRWLFERRWRALLARYPPAPLASRRARFAARDLRSLNRVLVVGDTQCAEAFADAVPSARITLAAATSGRDTVELVDEVESVLRERRFHFDALVATPRMFESLKGLIAETQPQASLLRTGEPSSAWLG